MPMTRARRVSACAAFVLLLPFTASAQDLDAPARIVLLVDSSSSMSAWTNDFRAGLTAFIDELPGVDEVALVSTGGQLRVRVEPTTDRSRVREAAAGFFADGGANAFLDSLVEADERLLASAPDMWPVFVILTTDSGQAREDQNLVRYNQFAKEFVERRGTAYAVVIAGSRTGIPTELSMNLTRNTRGFYESMSLANSLPAKMREVAALIYRDFHPKIR